MVSEGERGRSVYFFVKMGHDGSIVNLAHEKESVFCHKSEW